MANKLLAAQESQHYPVQEAQPCGETPSSPQVVVSGGHGVAEAASHGEHQEHPCPVENAVIYVLPVELPN